jgi:uncharacterized protein (TIGR02001 family)
VRVAIWSRSISRDDVVDITWRRLPHAGAWAMPMLLPVLLAPSQRAMAVSAGGDVAVTSDYIYRGLSESNGNPAVQIDLHAGTNDGSYAGVWATTRSHKLDPGADYNLVPYLGRRFNIDGSWNATLSAQGYFYLGGKQEISNDYQEVTASISCLDRWTFSVSWMPDAVWYWNLVREGRAPAFVVETTGQWLIWNSLSVTGGAGYFHFTGLPSGSEGPGVSGYAYGNVGLAYEWRSWRVDVGYFRTQKQATRILEYPLANDRVAGTVSWHF